MSMSNKIDIENEQFQNFTTKKMTVSFHNVVYEVQKKMDDVPICGKWETKTILKGVSGCFNPGLNAIMGPTGSGKTSLLDVIAKRKDPKGLKEGAILLDGELPPDDFQLISGYVVQEDIVMGTLTVRENLMFSTNLRLSNKEVSKKSREKKVDEVIKQLGLSDCADTKVGTELIRGVSGGEKKRCNIGMELVLDPQIMFLDEPTTGLDSNTANSIVLLLHKLVKQGKNIILSIHQPRYSIFSLFDNLLILQQGEIVYRGECKSAVSYFSSVGFNCPQYHNPADYFLDVVGNDASTAELLERLQEQKIEEEEESSIANGSAVVDVPASTTRDLAELFQNHDMSKVQKEQLQEILGQFESKQAEIMFKRSKNEYPNGFFTQLQYVYQRTFRNLIRNPVTSVAQVFMMVFFGVLIGLIYFDVDTTPEGLQNRVGCFFFLIMSQVMSNLSALELFINNRKFFVHESASGYYRVSVHFISSIFADLLPNRLIPNLFFCSIIYFMIGLAPTPGQFFFFFLAVVSTALAATSAAYLVSSSVSVFALANIVLAIPFLLMMMFGGFLVNIGTLLVWLEWIKWLSIFRYGYNALVVNEMTGLVFYANTSNPHFDPTSEYPCFDTVTHLRLEQCVTGEEYMMSQKIPYGVKEMWINIIALWSMTIGFLILCYIQMRRINKYK